ncbi:MAG: acyl-CoA synthetase [Acidimicrobiales bacterium]|nr:acyl-CoA synthetase [Acidimicrobiales bacterium]
MTKGTTVALLRDTAQAVPDGEAFVDGTTRLTFGAWDRAADGLATALAERGVGRGDVVALLLPSSADYATCYAAAMRLGAITTGINLRLGPAEVASIVERTRPALAVVDDGTELPAGVPAVLRRSDLVALYGLDPPSSRPRLDPSDPVAVVWTSGTTGVPKGAVFDHANLRDMAPGAGALSADGDRRLSPLPFAHVGYMTRMWDELVHRITTVITPTPWKAAGALRLIEEERVTVGQGVPTQWALMLADPTLSTTDVSSLRLASTGAARVPAELVREMRERLGCPVVVRYASTEASLITGTRLGDPDEVVAETVGRASEGVELRLVGEEGGPVGAGDVGMVQCRSGAAMRGYWEDPERTAEVLDPDGWVSTGDLGWLGDDGNLRLVGRRTEMYVRGGYNVYPAEVEAVLGEHPAVDRAAVVGLPAPVLGDVGWAFVVPAPGTTVDPDELRAWCRSRLADYKAPDHVRVVDDLPLTSMLKVDKRALAGLVAAS